MNYRPFSPPDFLRQHSPEMLARARRAVAEATTSGMQARCAKLFAEPMSDLVCAQLWIINEELNCRGIGPRWRGFGDFNPNAVPKYTADSWPEEWGVAPLGDAMKRKLLVRWCDAAWLRRQLGPSHIPRAPTWRPLFLASTSADDLETIYARLAESDEANVRLTYDLSVPTLHALALRGFVVTGVADRHAKMRKRMRAKIGPALDALAHRSRYALTSEQIQRRRVYAEAIELAQGSTTDAAEVVMWISGEPVSPQGVDKMRRKIAVDVGLSGKKWIPKVR